MKKLVPLTKIIITVAAALWAIILHQPVSLLLLCGAELILLLLGRQLKENSSAVFLLAVFAVCLGIVQYIGGGSIESCYVASLRMLAMTLVFIMLLGTTRLQDLTASMVQQLHVPYEYAFMFTAGLRFVPDFLEENRMVMEAQACRGLAVHGNFFRKIKMYMSIVQPLILRSLGRSESMALSLELRGFGGSSRTFLSSVSPHGIDYAVILAVAAITLAVIYGRIAMGM